MHCDVMYCIDYVCLMHYIISYGNAVLVDRMFSRTRAKFTSEDGNETSRKKDIAMVLFQTLVF